MLLNVQISRILAATQKLTNDFVVHTISSLVLVITRLRLLVNYHAQKSTFFKDKSYREKTRKEKTAETKKVCRTNGPGAMEGAILVQ